MWIRPGWSQLQPLAPNATIIVNANTKPAKLVVWGFPADHQRLKKALERLRPTGDIDHTAQLEVYPLTKADPTTVQALLQSLVPDAKISLDPQTKKLVALAFPDDQKAVKAVVDQLEAENPPGKQPQFETYPLFGLDVAKLVTNLQTAVPNGKFMVDEKAGKLVVFGTPSDQETVKTALEKLRGGPANGPEAQLQVYRLTKADPTTATALLQSVVPQAKLTVDPQTKILIALATPADQQTIKTTLDQLQPKSPAPTHPS